MGFLKAGGLLTQVNYTEKNVHLRVWKGGVLTHMVFKDRWSTGSTVYGWFLWVLSFDHADKEWTSVDIRAQHLCGKTEIDYILICDGFWKPVLRFESDLGGVRKPWFNFDIAL